MSNKKIGEKEHEDSVVVYIPKNSKHDDAQYVAVNGQRILVRKGENVAVPAKFAEVINNSFEAQRTAESFIEAVSKI